MRRTEELSGAAKAWLRFNQWESWALIVVSLLACLLLTGCCGMGFIDDQTASSGERKVFYMGKPPPVDKAVVGRDEEKPE